MSKVVRLSKKIISDAKVSSEVSLLTVSEQIEHWVKIGKIVEENPDLTYEFIKNIIASREEAEDGKLEIYKNNRED